MVGRQSLSVSVEHAVNHYLAHRSATSGQEEPLSEHLKLVAERARSYASVFDAADEAYLAGLLHDLGKYGDLFQQRLRGEAKAIDHWSAGAWVALKDYKLIAAALAIQGHHIGLQVGSRDSLLGLNPHKLVAQHPLGLRLSERDADKLMTVLKDDSVPVISTDSVQSALSASLAQTAASMLDVRMLFSALVDADFVETEAWFHMDRDGRRHYREEGLPLGPANALARLQSHLVEVAESSYACPSITQLRADLLRSCLEAAPLPQGLFTLTAPTGSGKTFSMLAFALAHAAKHKLERIVVVIPYLTIIEQTTAVYRKVFEPFFGANTLGRYILEHHSLSGIHTQTGSNQTGEDYQRRLLTENWDAPIVVTTNVQLLESLFSNRPSACRKLHRLARSIILFDEVQTMPISLAIPTLATLSRLAERYCSTIVFATATQPAFNHLDAFVKRHCNSGWQPREIVPDKADLFARSKRVDVEWSDESISWSDLAGKLAVHQQAMCVVNLKRHARDLFDTLRRHGKDSAFHLSTNMCPAHRQLVLEKVRSLLASGEPCHLISTQCVEAGVDIDFPAVYRALGPLEAIAQAAGRCNRNGRLESGEVHVFIPETEGRPYPDGAYAQAAGVTNLLFVKHGVDGIDINDPDLYQRYYVTLYDFARPEEHAEALVEGIQRQDFLDVAKEYRIIAQDTINVLVPYDRDAFARLRDKALNEGLSRKWIALARPHTVSLFRPKATDLLGLPLESIRLEFSDTEYSDEWYICKGGDAYDEETGLNPSLSPNVTIA